MVGTFNRPRWSSQVDFRIAMASEMVSEADWPGLLAALENARWTIRFPIVFMSRALPHDDSRVMRSMMLFISAYSAEDLSFSSAMLIPDLQRSLSRSVKH